MQIFKSILLKIYMVWVVLVFSVFMILLLPVFIIPILIGQRYGSIAYGGIRIWAWIFSKLTFIRYEIRGRDNIDKTESYIYTSNHTSFLDAPGLALGIPTQFRPLAKKELLKIPVFGLIVRVVTIVVDRSNQESRKKSVKKLSLLLNQGLSILIFPEGTQNRTDKILQPFYDGAFRIAIASKKPIMPIVIVNAGKLMPPSTLHIKPGKIQVIFGEPIYPDGLTQKDIKVLKQKTFSQMEKILIEASG
ncbi:MAG: lysophospholipid acyltransferase family protein [Fulvivirga sp.]|nr:lysophospholipid acyltransferase family protein [Fulvivirga sp.]